MAPLKKWEYSLNSAFKEKFTTETVCQRYCTLALQSEEEHPEALFDQLILIMDGAFMSSHPFGPDRLAK